MLWAPQTYIRNKNSKYFPPDNGIKSNFSRIHLHRNLLRLIGLFVCLYYSTYAISTPGLSKTNWVHFFTFYQFEFCYSVSSDKRINASATFAQRPNTQPRHRGRHDGKDGTESTLHRSPSPPNTQGHRVTCHREHPVLSHLQWSSLVCEHELNTGIPIINMLWWWRGFNFKTYS